MEAKDWWSLVIGGWGAVLSTILALRELRKGRVRLVGDLKYCMGRPERVIITNLSSQTLYIDYYQFFRKVNSQKKYKEIDVGMYEGCLIGLGGNKTTSFEVYDTEYEAAFDKAEKLYVDLSVKCRNYGNAANQVLFPLGNDNANLKLFLIKPSFFKRFN